MTRRLLPRHEAALTQQRARRAAVAAAAAANDRALAVATLAADRLHGSIGHDDQRPRYAHLTHDEPERLRTYTVRGHAGQLYVQVTTYGQDDRHSITITNASPHAIRAILAALPAT